MTAFAVRQWAVMQANGNEIAPQENGWTTLTRNSEIEITYNGDTKRIELKCRGKVVLDKPISEIDEVSELDNAIQ